MSAASWLTEPSTCTLRPMLDCSSLPASSPLFTDTDVEAVEFTDTAAGTKARCFAEPFILAPKRRVASRSFGEAR